MNKKHELTSLQDIFEKVPADRMQDCCREIGMYLAQTKELCELAGGEGLTEISIEWPIIWVDDGEGKITSELKIYSEDGEHQQTVVLTSKPQDGDL